MWRTGGSNLSVTAPFALMAEDGLHGGHLREDTRMTHGSSIPNGDGDVKQFPYGDGDEDVDGEWKTGMGMESGKQGWGWEIQSPIFPAPFSSLVTYPCNHLILSHMQVLSLGISL
ncbi:hypothetical protein Tco_0509724 [Tanacetum coccineum]